jgi:sigma-B regulation protein RsbU (phosphoserine phosphatase)
MVMSATAAIIKSLISLEPNIDVAILAGQLNDLLVKEIIKEREMFVTMFMCKFDLEAGQLIYCNAGHLPGLFWDHNQKAIRELPEGGPIVGQFGGIQFRQGICPISSGDRLFLFTDGLTEAVDIENNLFGRERVEEVYTAEIDSTPKDFCLKVKDWVDKFTQGTDEDSWDDFTLMQILVE